ncbi:MAG: hypothetical protein US31_C0011G0018 [Berkelbacteria bacterium GW2011_GWA1_36_9]|uniref:NYN domain-containing protein n=1 Tax=Berkelbacteria bacterium GW2011_GWA1_36_9 TaxID=1618331 RepID=A0A0G0IPT8_9BACT|nr:MAG: hypothetical protein US31_C0011G0018 [Berkelbacteria bacterium GW2011_GWA1_36_9]
MIIKEDYLIKFLNDKSKRAMICIDWANVYNWEITKRKERVIVEEQKIDHLRLYNYLRKINQIKEIKLFYGLDKAREDVLDNIVRWVEKITGKKPLNITELYQEIEKIRKKTKLSDAMWLQIKEVFDEYFSAKRLDEFKKIGFDVSNQKNVKSFSNSLYHLSKFKTVLEKLDRIITSILNNQSNCSTKIEKELIEQTKELRNCLNQKIKDRKCDFDVDIVVEIMKHIDKYDTFVIFSGDGDFAPAIKFFREKSKNIIVVSQSNKLGKEIVDLTGKDKPIIILSEKIDEIWVKKIPRR